MPHESIRRLSLADLDETRLRKIIGHGEDLFVERKRQPPSGAGLGASVASFANMMGGWLLLGIDEQRTPKGQLAGTTIVGFDFGSNVDLQSHLGQLLRSQVDPLPPFVADYRTVDGQIVTVLRIFESADTPHIVTDTGAVYIRTSSGKVPVTDQRLLLELGRRGEEAKAAAARRLSFRPDALPLVRDELMSPQQLMSDVAIAVTMLASPFTVTPHFNDWAVSLDGAQTCERLAGELAARRGVTNADLTAEPRARGHAAWWAGGSTVRVRGRAVIDSGGVIGAKLDYGLGDATITLGTVRSRYLDPLVGIVAEALEEAEAYGRTEWHAIIEFPSVMNLSGVPNPSFSVWHASRELAVPSTAGERSALSRSFSHELARQAGVPEYD